ncbi:MAG: DedA family protein [Planctomycetaceae bacterium]|nr:DedA family protein [Planctomycetaceae bacterium]
MTEQIVAHLGYVGIALILILGGLGLPIPEEAPVILAAVLSRNGKLLPPLALATCLLGVLAGDFVVYFLGYFYGEKVLSLPLTRRLLTRAREAQIKGYFHRHGFKILVLGRFAAGFRTAAYLTAGILKLPPLKLFLIDLVAASLSTFLMFGLGFIFAYQIQSGLREMQQWFTLALGAGLAIWLSYRFYAGRKRAGLPVGPPVLFGEEPPLPPDDLRAHSDETQRKVDSSLDLKPPDSTSLAEFCALPPAAPPLPAPAPLTHSATDSGPARHAADLPTGADPVDVGLPQAHSRTSLGSHPTRPGHPVGPAQSHVDRSNGS